MKSRPAPVFNQLSYFIASCFDKNVFYINYFPGSVPGSPAFSKFIMWTKPQGKIRSKACIMFVVFLRKQYVNSVGHNEKGTYVVPFCSGIGNWTRDLRVMNPTL